MKEVMKFQFKDFDEKECDQKKVVPCNYLKDRTCNLKVSNGLGNTILSMANICIRASNQKWVLSVDII